MNVFSNVIFRTAAQQLDTISTDSASRGPSAIAELLVNKADYLS